MVNVGVVGGVCEVVYEVVCGCEMWCVEVDDGEVGCVVDFECVVGEVDGGGGVGGCYLYYVGCGDGVGVFGGEFVEYCGVVYFVEYVEVVV